MSHLLSNPERATCGDGWPAVSPPLAAAPPASSLTFTRPVVTVGLAPLGFKHLQRPPPVICPAWRRGVCDDGDRFRRLMSGTKTTFCENSSPTRSVYFFCRMFVMHTALRRLHDRLTGKVANIPAGIQPLRPVRERQATKLTAIFQQNINPVR